MCDKNRVAITGMGCVTAAGATLPLTLAAIDEGIQNASPQPFEGIAPPSPVFRVFVDLPLENTLFSRTVRLVFAAAAEALASAGNSGAAGFAPSVRMGVCIGTSVGASLRFSDYYRAWHKGETFPLGTVEMFAKSNPGLALAGLLRANGPVQTVANACSSGADALGLAASWIKQGLCDVAVAGGADELCQISYTGFSRLMITSSEKCAPFDAGRSGLNLGEGAGIMVLERESSALLRGARIYGRLAGYGTATDSHHLTAPHPNGEGLLQAYGQAFNISGLSAGDVAFINAHGTATKTNDLVEGAFFNKHFAGVPFVATKGATGHTLGAAGAIEAVITVAHLMRGYLPSSPGFSAPDPETFAAPVTGPATVGGVVAASQSLAFGGNNSVLLFAKGENE